MTSARRGARGERAAPTTCATKSTICLAELQVARSRQRSAAKRRRWRERNVVGAAPASVALLLLLSYCGAASPPPLSSPPPPSTQYRLQLTRLASAAASQSLPGSNLTQSPRRRPLPAAASRRYRTTRSPSPLPPYAEPEGPRLLMTGAVYVAGHSVPHPELCPALGERLQLMIFVASAPAHFVARTAIRLTWGIFAARTDISLAFVVGATPDASAQAVLALEEAVFRDVVRANFVDSYSNLTLKTISMLEWADNYCPRARRFLKTDDDMFVNVPRLFAFAERHAADTRTIYGKVVRRVTPHSTTEIEHHVSQLQFRGKVFPDFTKGGSYMLTSDCVRPLYARALTQPYVLFEDEYVTGVIAAQLNISRVHSADFDKYDYRKVQLHACDVRRGISIHNVGYDKQFQLWRELFDSKINCAKTATNRH